MRWAVGRRRMPDDRAYLQVPYAPLRCDVRDSECHALPAARWWASLDVPVRVSCVVRCSGLRATNCSSLSGAVVRCLPTSHDGGVRSGQLRVPALRSPLRFAVCDGCHKCGGSGPNGRSTRRLHVALLVDGWSLSACPCGRSCCPPTCRIVKRYFTLHTHYTTMCMVCQAQSRFRLGTYRIRGVCLTLAGSVCALLSRL
jgi:hypothetical protein